MGKAKEETIYLVVTNYNFDTDMDIKSFNTEEEAKGYMKSLIHKEYRIETEEHDCDPIVKEADDYVSMSTPVPEAMVDDEDPDGGRWDTIEWRIIEMNRSEIMVANG